ncbi:MAG: adenylosuccinate synthase [Anaerolineae bacterium]|nr:adenylosuccinate synthase [Thermoflexales bacterium]MDW8408743.1 adenylosuccinate synthase [Anaerolineae bacterium]
MSITVLLGAQWGDEGKGRITDALAAQADVVARFNGGDNAGHSITVGARVVRLHQVPSGIFRAGCLNVIGNGVVLNPRNLLKEIAEIEAAGAQVTPECLRISQSAHVILPGHIALDAARETSGDSKIGTTQRGIGYAYMDKASRSGIRAGAMADPQRFADRVHQHIVAVNTILERDYNKPALDADALAAEYAAAAHRLAPFLANTTLVLHRALEQGKHVLAEGAQGVLLDIDHGTYPFVTSSNATIGGVCTGLGVPPRAIQRVIGVAKAFSTRVGGGPFVTELHGDLAMRLRGTGANPWDEYGSTTGRPRRVGWLDALALRYMVRLNGMDELALTKLDILSGLDTLRIAVAYTCQGIRIDDLPQDSDVLAECRPVYEDLPGWSEDVRSARAFADLPRNAQAYIARIEELVGAPVSIVSVGPERDQMIVR